MEMEEKTGEDERITTLRVLSWWSSMRGGSKTRWRRNRQRGDDDQSCLMADEDGDEEDGGDVDEEDGGDVDEEDGDEEDGDEDEDG